MKMPQSQSKSLRDSLAATSDSSGAILWTAAASVSVSDLVRGSSLGGGLAQLHGRSVLIATQDQLTTALALIELDGVARRLTICPPDLPAAQLSHVIATTQADAVVFDRKGSAIGACDLPLQVTCSPTITPAEAPLSGRLRTEWIMLTSGTTGMPKMVVHSLSSLTAAIKGGPDRKSPIVWGTFYDIRRYGGLQIFFRAVLDGGSLVLSEAKEPTASHLVRLGKRGVTHISGTPSHWRRALMSSAGDAISPRYVRLSGEIADQAILDNLRAFYPQARIGHAYAST